MGERIRKVRETAADLYGKAIVAASEVATANAPRILMPLASTRNSSSNTLPNSNHNHRKANNC